MNINEEKCVELGLDPKAVKRVARAISRNMLAANKMGLILFGGAGSADLRPSGSGAQNIVAHLDGSCDGGDGGDEY